MSIILKQIVAFNESGEKRNIPFEEGLNIISGDSKTGKSALIEIVDYCLFSSRSSIPVGEIINFTKLFVVIYKVNDFFIVIGRPAPKTGSMRSAYLKVETDYNNIENLEYNYFNELALKPIKDDIQNDFEELLGLSLKKLESDYESFGKLSIRDTVSFLFQHQNLIANKHALFYRFDDLIKRKRVIQALPVLLGIVDSKYYQLIKSIRELELKIKAEEKLIERLKQKDSDQIDIIRNHIQNYYTLLDLRLDDEYKSLTELKKIGSNLPLPPQIIDNESKLYTKIDELEKEIELLNIEKAEIEKAISSLHSNTDETFDYVQNLKRINSKQKYNIENSNIICPLCENSATEINENISKLNDSKQRLIEELTKVSSYTKDSTQILERLQSDKKRINTQIKTISKNLEILNKENVDNQLIKNKREKIIHQKGVIEATIKFSLESNDFSKYESTLKELKKELQENKNEILKYIDIKEFKKETELFLKEEMNRIADKLDFEKELKPIDFHFDIDNFEFYHKYKGEKIKLYEMGSGANWLACHLSIFLAFLHLSCKNSKSVIPNLLMLDQPSQVYFPRTAKKTDFEEKNEQKEYDENIVQVRKIFKVLEEEINIIYDKTNMKPQIIVLEHANDDEFKKYIIKEWDKNKGEGFI